MDEAKRYISEICRLIEGFEKEVTPDAIDILYNKAKGFADHVRTMSELDKSILKDFILSLHDTLCFLFIPNRKKQIPSEIYNLYDDIKNNVNVIDGIVDFDNIPPSRYKDDDVKLMLLKLRRSENKEFSHISDLLNDLVNKAIKLPPYIYSLYNGDRKDILVWKFNRGFKDYPLYNICIESDGIIGNLHPPMTGLNYRSKYENFLKKYCHVITMKRITGDLKPMQIGWTGNPDIFKKYWTEKFKMEEGDIQHLLQQCFDRFEGVNEIRTDFAPNMYKREIGDFIYRLRDKFKPTDKREAYVEMLKRYFELFKDSSKTNIINIIRDKKS